MDCEVVIVDGGEKMDGEDRPMKSQKRKRASSLVQEAFGATTEEREARLGELRKELERLFGSYKEVMGKKVVDLDMVTEKQWCNGASAVLALLMEERDLPLSKLVEEIHGEVVKTKKMGVVCCEGLTTVASVKSTVLLVGQRMMYGVPNADTDVLEGESRSCLWCWETRDLKLMPQSVRGVLNICRTCHKRIHERMTAVSGLRRKQKEKRNCLSNNWRETSERQRKRKKRSEKEVLKEKLQSQKEQERLQEEAEKDEMCREREESEMRKQLRKQQEEAKRSKMTSEGRS